MARTQQEVFNEIISYIESNTALTGLTSTSDTAIYRNIAFVVSQAIVDGEILQDIFTDQIEERANEIQAGVLRWYADQSLLFQYGDSLNIVTVEYDVLDTTKQIVDLSAAEVINGAINIKVAKLDGTDAIKLSTAEYNAFVQYWVEKRFAGETISVISTDSDKLKAEYLINVDPQLITLTGESTEVVGTFPVEDAINTYLQTFQAEDFNGTLQVMKLTSVIENVPGVLNAVANLIEARPDIGSFTDLLTGNQTYSSQAGYMSIDPLFPLSTSLSYE